MSPSKRTRLFLRAAGAALLGSSLLAGCAAQIPVDPKGTLQDVRHDTLRVGISPNRESVDVRDGQYTGDEVELVKDFAKGLDAEVQWTLGGEEHLVKQLKEGKLDMVAGGITAKTPWSKEVGITRPYRTVTEEDGKQAQLVLLVPPGENAFLGELEYFLDQTQEMP